MPTEQTYYGTCDDVASEVSSMLSPCDDCKSEADGTASVIVCFCKELPTLPEYLSDKVMFADSSALEAPPAT